MNVRSLKTALTILLGILVFAGYSLAQEKNTVPTAEIGQFELSMQALGRFGTVPHKDVKPGSPNYYAQFSLWVGAMTEGGNIYVTSGDHSGKNTRPEWIPVPLSWEENIESDIDEAKMANTGQFTDVQESGGNTPLGLLVTVTSYGFSDRGYALFDYVISLQEGYDPLNNLYIGFQADVDVPNPHGKLTSDDDRLGFLPNGKGIYIYNEEGKNEPSSPLGIERVGRDQPILSWWTRETDPANDMTRYELLQGKRCHPKNPSKADDYRFMVSDGPFNLQSGEAIQFTIGVVQASVHEDFLSEAQAADLLATRSLPKKGLAKGTAPGMETTLAGLSVPSSFKLHPGSPNPFNSRVRITFDLPESRDVEAVIYNLMGQPVRTLFMGMKEAGSYTLTWDGTDKNGNDVVSGVYLLIVQAGRNRFRQKLVLMK